MKPMLCAKLSIDDAKAVAGAGGYIVEKKYDGVRGYIKDGQLYDRRSANITAKFPEFAGLSKIKGIIDGEIMATSGQFTDVVGRTHMRDKFFISLIAKKTPAVFMAFDYVDDKPLLERKKLLVDEAGKHGLTWLKLAPFETLTEKRLNEMWEGVLENLEEGLVIKWGDSKYQEGKRSPDWYKVKAWVETVAVFIKHEPHPKGVRLETADGRSVNVNGAMAEVVRKTIDEHGKVECEVQFLPQQDSDAWRFPSFKRIAGTED
jgi:bifunctional non-homologous end joining protein LigD